MAASWDFAKHGDGAAGLTVSASPERGTLGPAPVAPQEGPNDTLSGLTGRLD